MANVSVDVQPGHYLNSVSPTVTFGDNVKEVSINLNGTPPSISKYIAYDTLVPPNPFIAVTQDGTGNVVYDGGFPKFYNNNAEDESIERFRYALKLNGKIVGSGEARSTMSEVTTLLATGDKLLYDVQLRGPVSGYAILGYTETLSDSTQGDISPMDGVSSIMDQDGVPAGLQSASTLHPKAVDQWYSREIDLSSLNDTLIRRWDFVCKSSSSVETYAYVRNVRVVSSSGAVKLQILAEDTFEVIDTKVYGGYTLVEAREASSFDDLSAPGKYMLNCLNFVADQSEVKWGNRKILLVGDKSVSPYQIKGLAGNDFKITFDRIAYHGYWDITMMDTADYSNGLIDIRLAELKQYVAVIFLGSGEYSDMTPNITVPSINAFATYRAEGGGLILVTDHGDVLDTIEDAMANHSGFFRTVNAIAVNFGAWFSDDFDRSPVNVGHLRSTYGDHPLYANLLDSEDIHAGGSESRVFTTSDPLLPVAEATNSFNITNGIGTINVVAVMEDGSIEAHTFTYNIVDYKLTFSNGDHTVDGGGTLIMGTKDKLNLSVKYVGDNSLVMSGRLFLNGIDIGHIRKLANGLVTTQYTNSYFNTNGLPINDSDYLRAEFTAPAGLKYEVRLSRLRYLEEEMMTLNSYSNVTAKLQPIYNEYSTIDKFRKIVNDAVDSGAIKRYSLSDTITSVKKHLVHPFKVMDRTFTIGVSSFNYPQFRCGFMVISGGGRGTCIPSTYKEVQVHEFNSPVDDPTTLTMSSRDTVFSNLAAMYIDGMGPLLLTKSIPMDSSGIYRYEFSNGEMNVHRYLEGKVGNEVAVRILG